MTDSGDRLDEGLDAVLHLLDRQVVDCDELMVCKVDDVELTEDSAGRLEVTGLLAGPAALVPRFGGRLGKTLLRYWHRLGIQTAGRTVPRRIDLSDVERLRSAVELGVPRKELLVPQGDPPVGHCHRRLNELLQMEVRDRDGASVGRIIDVRIEGRRTPPGRGLVLVGLLVGRGRPGSMLGYDRRADRGPWLVSRVLRRLHRHSGHVAMSDVVEIDWDSEVVTVSTSALEDLSPA